MRIALVNRAVLEKAEQIYKKKLTSLQECKNMGQTPYPSGHESPQRLGQT